VHGDHFECSIDAAVRLAQESLADRRRLEQLGRDPLQRDHAVELQLHRAIHDAHPPTPDDRLDPITGQHNPGRERAHDAVYIRTRELAPKVRARLPPAGEELHPKG